LLISVDGVVDPPDTEVILTPSGTCVIDIMGDGRPTGCDFFLVPDALGNVSGGVMLYQGNLEMPPIPCRLMASWWTRLSSTVQVGATPCSLS
jgi:hypothetical protein